MPSHEITMRSLGLAALLVATALAGCTSGGDVGTEDGPQVRIGLPDGQLIAGQEIQFRGLAQTGAEFTRWQWNLGDDTVIDGRTAVHTYSLAGTYDITLKAADDDGHFATDSATVEVLDGSTSPPPPIPAGDVVLSNRTLRLVGDEPTIGETYQLVWDGPSWANMTGTLTVFLPEGPLERSVQRSSTFSVPAEEAGRQEINWLFDGEDGLSQGSTQFDVWGQPIQFGEPTAQQWLRPGVQTYSGNAQCTTNFLFQYKWYRFFIGSAAHCVDEADLNEICQSGPKAKIGNKQTVSAHDGRSMGTTLAYSSWITMKEKGGGSCPANDFALYELQGDALDVMHPKALFYGGPSSMAPSTGYGTGTTLYGYGASQLHGNSGIGYPGQDAGNSKRGVSLGVTGGGYYQQMYFALPGVPGDSGGPAFGPGGEALGAASVIYRYPYTGSNSYTIIPMALAYMEEKEGWAPELITHDSFDAYGS